MDLTQPADNPDDSDEETDGPTLKRVKRPRTEKQEIVADAIEQYAVVRDNKETDVMPALESLYEARGDEYTTKAYLWQIRGEFFVVDQPVEDDADLKLQMYREAVKDLSGIV